VTTVTLMPGHLGVSSGAMSDQLGEDAEQAVRGESRGGGSKPPPMLELTVPAAPVAVGEARAAVRAFARAHGADEHTVVSIALAVSEAATNAVLHAFVGREPGHVRVLARTATDELSVYVVDDGRGMQPRTDSPGLGIGLPTMGQMASALDIREAPGGGTEVRMTFAVPGARGTPEADGDHATVHRLEHLMASVSEGVLVHHPSGRIIYANPAAARLLGAADVDEVLASEPGALSSRFRFTREDGSPLGRDDLPGQRLVGGENAPPLLMHAVHIASGRERWLLVTGTILDEGGPLAVNIIEDVTVAGRGPAE
jgi:anti-sigma regulatory factor (Ser/Thr protein kinase)